MKLPESLELLIEQLAKLPGIGQKSAFRLAMNMALWEEQDLNLFSQSVGRISSLKSCHKCHVYSDELVCRICSDSERQKSGIICVVESISDLLALENSEQYQGLYYVLGGVLNPLLGVGPQELNLDNLIKRVQEEKINNVILAINPSVEGDATCSYIKELLPDTINIERIGFGIPMGGSLEYVDSMTISKALENRKVF